MPHQIGYCTNVHAGADLEQTRSNLRQHAVAVKSKFSPNSEMGVGLWLSDNSARQLLDTGVDDFASWLAEQGLLPFTLNGFPYGDFHEPVVKHRVYEPTWYEPARLEYTLNLIEILDRLLPPGVEGSISTLPICWGDPGPNSLQIASASNQLRQVADRLAELEAERGRLIYVCIEPEPGCYLQRSEDIVAFYRNHLLPDGGDQQRILRHIRVCHDICHAAVMFEQQAEVLQRFRSEGILVGKIQVSSAVMVDFAAIEPTDRAAAVQQLSAFAEDRYLHQTTVRGATGETFFEDLPGALATVENPSSLVDQWRIHFHVPVYLARFGLLGTSQEQIRQCLEAARSHSDVHHFEVETYAWGVLPDELKQPDLASGIAQELTWFSGQIG